jgi:hypothetical protein
MIAFDISINGESRVLAGVGDVGVLSAILTWGSASTAMKGSTDLNVGGISGPSEHVQWLREQLKVGDTIFITIREVSDVDAPKQRLSAPIPKKKGSPRLRVVDSTGNAKSAGKGLKRNT